MRAGLMWLSLAALVPSQPTVLAQRPDPDSPEFRQSTFRALLDDTAALRRFAFQREVIRRSLRRDGSAKSVEILTSHVTPRAVGFDEHLVEIDGRRPTDGEVARHRSDAIFSKHHQQLMQGSVDFGLAVDLRLSVLLQTYDYEFAGEEEIHGVSCYRFRVQPFTPPDGATRTERIAAASRGNFWFTQEGHHLVRMEVRLARPLRAAGVALRALDLRLDKERIDGIWLMAAAEIRSEFRLGVVVRKHNTWRYSNFVSVMD